MNAAKDNKTFLLKATPRICWFLTALIVLQLLCFAIVMILISSNENKNDLRFREVGFNLELRSHQNTLRSQEFEIRMLTEQLKAIKSSETKHKQINLATMSKLQRLEAEAIAKTIVNSDKKDSSRLRDDRQSNDGSDSERETE